MYLCMYLYKCDTKYYVLVKATVYSHILVLFKKKNFNYLMCLFKYLVWIF